MRQFLGFVIDSIHFGIVFLILFGWLFDLLFFLYGITLIATILSWVVFRRCVLVDIERGARGIKGKHNKSFIVGVFHRWFGEQSITDRFITSVGSVFLIVSLIAWVYTGLVRWSVFTL